MKRCCTMVVLLCMVLGAAPAFAQEWTGNFNVLLGAKNLDEDDWAPAEEHGELGLEFDVRHESWPVNLVLGLLLSGADETGWHQTPRGSYAIADIEAATVELHVGARKIIDSIELVRPYFGAGIAMISAAADVSVLGLSQDDSDGGMGFYAEAGVYVTLAERVNLGLDFKYSEAEATLFNNDVEVGGAHVALLGGVHW